MVWQLGTALSVAMAAVHPIPCSIDHTPEVVKQTKTNPSRLKNSKVLTQNLLAVTEATIPMDLTNLDPQTETAHTIQPVSVHRDPPAPTRVRGVKARGAKARGAQTRGAPKVELSRMSHCCHHHCHHHLYRCCCY